MDMSSIGATITARRAELGLTQETLAQRSKVSRRTLVSVEAGESDIGLRRLLRIFHALGLSIAVTPGAGRPTESQLRDIFSDDE